MINAIFKSDTLEYYTRFIQFTCVKYDDYATYTQPYNNLVK